jgi:peptide/nickel transport system permease protein
MIRGTTLKIGVTLVSLIVGMTILSFFWTPHDPLAIDATRSLAPNSISHPLGTDMLGRDVLSNIIVGARSTLLVAVLSVAIAMAVGIFAGVAGALLGSRARSALVFATDIVLALPGVLLAIVLAAVYGPSTFTATLAIGVALSAAVAQVTRRAALTVLSQDYVLAAIASGSSRRRMVLRHVLPNLRANLLIQASGAAAIAILAESTLSYLGLGTVPPTPSWGRMLAESQQFLILDPIVALWPGLFIALAVLGFNLMGDGLRESLDSGLESEPS